MGGRGRGSRGNKRGRTQRRDFRDGRPNIWKKSRVDNVDSTASDPRWEPFVMESPAFEIYYQKQHIVPEHEWATFLETLRKPLPTSFRINGSGQFAHDIRDQMQHEFFDYSQDGVEIDGEKLEPIKSLPWYPDKLAWQIGFSRMQLRKMPVLERIHEFLKQENEIGSITRQEAVSMIPPLFLDVQPHHHVLDMCAAPGSKTFQLLELIHKGEDAGKPPQGLVVANDLDVQRCHLLIHQTKRMCSPNILVTNHEAQHFPGLRYKRKEDNYSEASASDDLPEIGGSKDEHGLLFDRILCDVPCSGDGTIRKAPDIWKKWNVGIANGLHRLQVQIAMRGVALLRVGGRLVYSTCSLNPIENEAVVGEILRESSGSLELLDVSNELPELKRRPGLATWKVRDKQRWLCSFSQVDRHRAGAVVPGMFPSGIGSDEPGAGYTVSSSVIALEKPPEVILDAEDKEKDGETHEAEGDGEFSSLPLDRCMRILPHDQDTGGFFIAVFRKVSTLKVLQSKNFLQNKDENVGLDKGKLCDASMEDYESVPKTSLDNIDTVFTVDPVKVSDIRGGKEVKSQEVVTRDDDRKVVERSSILTNKDSVTEKENLSVSGEDDIHDNKIDRESEALEFGKDGVETADTGDNEVDDENKMQHSKPLVKGRFQQQGRWRGVDPVLFLKDEQVINSLVSYYGIKESLPLKRHLITRSEDTSRLKRIYYVSQSVGDVIMLNFQTGEQLKITSAGLKIFERQAPKEGSSPCAFRIASEGLPVLLPHISKQIVYAPRKDFQLLLLSKAVPFTAFNDPEFATALKNLLPGCCVVVLPGKTLATGEEPSTTVGCWRGRSNVSLLITRAEAGQMLQRLSISDDNLPQEGLNQPEQETISE